MNALQTTLKQLRLSGLIETLDVRLQEAAANRLSHAEFLELICQDELNVRQQRQVIAITGKSYRVKEAPVVTQENKKSRKSNEPATAGAAS